jgi:hypothetical protein
MGLKEVLLQTVRAARVLLNFPKEEKIIPGARPERERRGRRSNRLAQGWIFFRASLAASRTSLSLRAFVSAGTAARAGGPMLPRASAAA